MKEKHNTHKTKIIKIENELKESRQRKIRGMIVKTKTK